MDKKKPPAIDSDPSLIIMQDLDPSPVEETPPVDPELEKDLGKSSSSDPNPYFRRASASNSSSSTASTLGLSSRSLPQILQGLQKYSTVLPSIYFIMHYTNTAIIPTFTQSLQKSDNLLLLTRPYYQSPAIEPVLIVIPLFTHILSGVALRLYRRRQSAIRHGAETHADRRKIPWPKLSLQSALGYTLWPLYAGHIMVNRMIPLQKEGGSSGVGLRYVAHGFARHPIVANLGYAALVGVASFHMVCGAAKWLKLSSEFVTEGGDYGIHKRRKRGWIVNAVAGVVAAVWMVGGLGVIGRGGAGVGWEAAGWDNLYRQIPLVGQWM